MLIGNWRMVEAGGDRLPAGSGVLLTFGANGKCANDKGRSAPGSFEYDEATKILRITETDGREHEMPVVALGEDRLEIKMGPEICVFERTEQSVSLEAPAPPPPPPTIYQLSFSTDQCAVEATLNGFPVMRSSLGDQGVSSQPVNTLLVGDGNRLVIRVTARGENARLETTLDVMVQGDVVEVGPGLGAVSLPDGDPPLDIVETFDSPVAPFAALLARARAASADDALDFGVHLRDVLRSGDAAATAVLFDPKAELFADAFGQGVAVMRGQIAGTFDMLFGSDLAFERGDLTATPHCDGKLWMIARADGRDLIHAEDSDGGSSQISIVAADLGDGFRVVR